MPDWYLTKDGDKSCLALYLRHYSSKKRPAGKRLAQFVGPGEHIVLRTGDGDAVWVWRQYKDDTYPPQHGVECSLFRNEGSILSSILVRQADAVADLCWPGCRHYTKVNPRAVRSKNPGFCFMAAGWRRAGMTQGGLIIFDKRCC